MYIYMHMNTNDENIWIAIEDKDVRQDERRGLDIGVEWAGAVVGAAERARPCRSTRWRVWPVRRAGAGWRREVVGAQWRVARGRARWRADDEGSGRCSRAGRAMSARWPAC